MPKRHQIRIIQVEGSLNSLVEDEKEIREINNENVEYWEEIYEQSTKD